MQQNGPGQIREQLINNFTYHPPFGDQPERYVKIREAIKALSLLIEENTPPSREQSLAFTHLDYVNYCANAAIARHETPPQE